VCEVSGSNTTEKLWDDVRAAKEHLEKELEKHRTVPG